MEEISEGLPVRASALARTTIVASRGAAVLDEAAASGKCDNLIPTDWRTRLNHRMLIIEHPDCCVLGQLGKPRGLSFGDMIDALDLRDSEEPGELTRLGFALDWNADYRWAELQQAWDDLLETSRA
jgi:hypothetical protein